MIQVPEGTKLSKEQLLGIDGNAFSVIGAVAKGLRRAGNAKEIVDAFTTEAMSGDYNHVLATAIAFTEPNAVAGGYDDDDDDYEDDE